MTPTQRRVHRVVWIALAPALLTLIIAAVLSRPDEPVQQPPAGLAEPGP